MRVIEPDRLPGDEPLTVEQLREMDGMPVWLSVAGGVWGLVNAFDDCVVLSTGWDIKLCSLSGCAYVHPSTYIDREAWVSVEDRLPEEEKPVLAYYGFYRENDDLGARFIGTLTYFSHDPEPHWQHESTGLFVTHWMPLPEPPVDKV